MHEPLACHFQVQDYVQSRDREVPLSLAELSTEGMFVVETPLLPPTTTPLPPLLPTKPVINPFLRISKPRIRVGQGQGQSPLWGPSLEF